MSEIKQVKVDNWGIYFLQRLKHFFNRTDYCDLTLQFQDNAQLKVHRLVLSACTEYFELLERTCEMYEDCLVMPDDLQADVVVPIVNFMYTGQLDFKPELLEKLYQTSQVMNMPVLTKLLDAHRSQPQRVKPSHDYRNIKSYSKSFESSKQSKSLTAVASTSYVPTKRSYSKAFNNSLVITKNKKPLIEKPVKEKVSNNGIQQSYPEPEYPVMSSKNQVFKDPRPTRYELPEELDVDNVFESSFTSISYTSTPLMVHPETVKRYSSKKSTNFDDATSTKRFIHHGTDVVECKKISMNENIFDDENSSNSPEDIFASISINSKDEQKDASQLFDQILDSDSQKSTIEPMETERTKPKLDHAKIISEVLKKYPHLVKSNKNIKLKILNTPKAKKTRTTSVYNEEKETKSKVEPPDFTYEFDVIDSKEAARLIAMGAENVKGPWICLICGTPGRALHFTSYYKFRRHLVEVHNEKPIPNICEYCGLKSLKRNYILHHLYTKHGVPPPPHYNFPKCNLCNYVALTEAYLVKHKMSHVEHRTFGCNVCAASFNTSNQLLVHIQKTGHKYSADRKNNLQCIYCFKTFSRETNLYTHLKIHHKESATSDGIIDESDEEKQVTRLKPEKIKNVSVKYEIPVSFENEYENIDIQYQIEQKPDGNIHILSKSPQTPIQSAKHKILNPGFNSPTKSMQKPKLSINNTLKSEFLQEPAMSVINNQNDGVVMIDGNEYIVKDNQLIPKNQNTTNEEYLLTNVIPETEQVDENSMQAPSIDFPELHHDTDDSKTVVKKTPNMSHQHIQIVVSNEEEYKALMSANHSIIFEDDPNKTLTMLTAPQNASLEGATIDLDTTQSNDMMIIQEEYPLNVTETVAAENPNIVVVYSHPVDDQTKQFQYITSQGIEAQFIQSSAMVTHNYETVTTSTPVMTAHVMETQIEESWQNNVKQPVDAMANESQLQQTEVTIQEKPDENFHSLNSIEEMSLPKTDKCTITSDVNSVKETIDHPSVENPNYLIEKGMDQTLEQEMSELPAINLGIPITNEQLVHKEIQTESTNNDNYNSVLMSHLDDKNKQSNVIQENYENSNIVEKTFDENEVTNDVSLAIKLGSDVVETTKPFDEEKDLTANNSTPIQMNNIEVTVTKVSNEQIEHLASEWVENESQNNIIINVSAPKRPTNIMTIDAEGSVYLEESIENIQQEVAKQMEAIATEKTSIAPVLEFQVVTTHVQPNVDMLSDVIKEEDISESTIQTDTDKISNKNDMVVVDNSRVQGNISQIIASANESESVIDDTSTETLKSTLENSDYPTRAVDHMSVKTEPNSAVNVVMENVLPDLLDQTSKSSIPSPKSEFDKSSIETMSQEDELKPLKHHTVITLNKSAHEKISSLLNDWEDNDSQQDDNKSDNELNTTEDKEVDAGKDDTIQEKINIASNNNIKSLVSDWDDDDEEVK